MVLYCRGGCLDGRLALRAKVRTSLGNADTLDGGAAAQARLAGTVVDLHMLQIAARLVIEAAMSPKCRAAMLDARL